MIAIIVNRRLPRPDTSSWQRSDAQHFIFPFKTDCWEFSLSNTLEDKCLEEKWILEENKAWTSENANEHERKPMF